ncbi:MAG: family 10 glycosylhydrolase [Clostridia bacterium]|nr:family 10 glycosylhydrolase [Clostridia bacterium]
MAILGMWVWPQNVNRRGAECVVRSCRQAGVTDLFFLTKGLSGEASYHSRFAPCSYERDLLREITDCAHRYGMRVHAWFTSTCDARYKQQHPESGRCHFVRGRDRELISLRDEGYLHYMETIIREVCSRYEVDGLHLDYIRYNHLLYGWGDEDMERYQAEGASKACLHALMQRAYQAGEYRNEDVLLDAYRSGDENLRAFARARRKDVVYFASALTAAARAERKDIILSAALMPEGAYADTAFSDLHYGQCYEDAANLYDYALPMAYSTAYGKDAAWVRRVAEGAVQHNVKTIVGLHAYEGGSGPALQADINVLQNVAVEGICLFREGATALAGKNGRKLCLYNALDEAITCVHVTNGTEEAMLNVEIAENEAQQLMLPFEAESIRVLTGEAERCVYVTRELFDMQS